MYQDSRGFYRQSITINGKRKVFSAKTRKDLMLKIAMYKDNVINHTESFRTIADMWEEQKQEKISRGTWRSYAAPLKDVVEETHEDVHEVVEDVADRIDSVHEELNNSVETQSEIKNDIEDIGRQGEQSHHAVRIDAEQRLRQELSSEKYNQGA